MTSERNEQQIPGSLARSWSGRVPPIFADGFYDHLMKTGVAEAQNIEGCLGALVLRNDVESMVQFTLITIWLDDASMTKFSSGAAAVLYSGDEQFELVPDRVVEVSRIAYLRIEK